MMLHSTQLTYIFDIVLKNWTVEEDSICGNIINILLFTEILRGRQKSQTLLVLVIKPGKKC